MGKVEQMELIKNGIGIQGLLNEGYKILGNPLILFDTDYRLIAYTDTPLDDPLWIEIVTTGTYSIESQVFFMDECFTDEVANAEKLAMMISDKLKYRRVLAHVFNGDGIKVANVLMMECNDTFAPDTLAAFEVLADMLSKEIRDDAHYIQYGESYQAAWIKRLIDYDLEERALYSPHVQILYNGFMTNLYLAVVDISKSKERHKGHEYFVDQFRRKRKDFKYSVYDRYIVMIISTDYDHFIAQRELSGLVDYFEQEDILVGVSSSFSNLFQLREYYAAAVQALNDNQRGSL